MEYPACPVTEELYELEGPNQPRILPCGHTLSYAALEQVRPALLDTSPSTKTAMFRLNLRAAGCGLQAAAPVHAPSNGSSPNKASANSATPTTRCRPRRSRHRRSFITPPGSKELQPSPKAWPACQHPTPVQILKSPDPRRRKCPIDRVSLKHTSADAYPTNFTMLEILRGLKAASARAPPTPPPPSTTTPVDTSAHDHLLAEYLQAAWNNQGDALGPNTTDLFGLDDLVDLGAAPTAAAAGRAQLDRAARQPPLALADVLPPSQRMSTAAWGVLESYYKLPADAVVGGPANWGPLGSDGDGAAVLHGTLCPPSVPVPPAIPCPPVRASFVK